MVAVVPVPGVGMVLMREPAAMVVVAVVRAAVMMVVVVVMMMVAVVMMVEEGEGEGKKEPEQWSSVSAALAEGL